MNKKQLIIAALATVMSVSAACATDITGVSGVGNVYNIDPQSVNGDVGYRQYTNFDLSDGDIANLIYRYLQSGGDYRDLSTFINLVDNKINIQGILNAVKADGSGHAIFISPKGMMVGSNGVLNVGTLSVITPTDEKYGQLKSDYAVRDFTNINQINAMRNSTPTRNNNYGGNAPVDIQGYVFARNGVDIRGSQVDVSGNIVNGYNQNNNFTTGNFDGKDSALALFKALVNTEEDLYANFIDNNGSSIVIKSGANAENAEQANQNYINVTGVVANLAKGETVLTNHGDAGLTLDGAVISGNGKVNIYNNNAAGALTIKNGAKVFAHQGDLSVTSKGGMDVKSGTTLKAGKNLEVVNKGNGKMTLNGTLLASNKVDILNGEDGNDAALGAEINGTIGSDGNKPDSIRIVNRNGKLVFAATAEAKNSVSVRNHGAGGADVNGSINAGEKVFVHNTAGNLTLDGNITASNNSAAVDIAIFNEGNGKLTTGENSAITLVSNNNPLTSRLSIKNTASGGMDLNGTISHDYESLTAINNGDDEHTSAGAMHVGGTIAVGGNLGIVNRSTGAMTVDAAISNNSGDTNVKNVNGESLTVGGSIEGIDGNIALRNANGLLTVNGQVSSQNGDIVIASRGNSDGIKTTGTSRIVCENGNLAIKHDGEKTQDNGKGIDLNGYIEHKGANGEVAINNYKGDMTVKGTIKTNVNTAIRNRTGAGDMEVNATITATSDGKPELRIQNYAGTGDMTVKGTITHNGRLNILNNEGTLTLDGTINNTGNDRTYAIAKGNSDGIEVNENFNAQSEDGMIYILNKTGQDGLQYKGSAQSTNGQVELYNMTGNMVVNGGTLSGNPTVILNKGAQLTVTNDAAVAGNSVNIVNNGSVDSSDTIGSNHKANFRQKLK